MKTLITSINEALVKEAQDATQPELTVVGDLGSKFRLKKNKSNNWTIFLNGKRDWSSDVETMAQQIVDYARTDDMTDEGMKQLVDFMAANDTVEISLDDYFEEQELYNKEFYENEED